MSEGKLTIRQMCDLFGVTPRTLRFYESKELIAPERQDQKRLYTKSDIARVKLILRGKRFGFSLEDIRQLLELYHLPDQQRTQIQRTFDLAQERLADLREQRDELDRSIRDLEEQIDWGARIIASRSQPTAAE